MLTIDRWRKWRAADQKAEESPGKEVPEVPKPSQLNSGSFGTLVLGATRNFSASLGVPADHEPDPVAHDPAFWDQELHAWAMERCTYQDGTLTRIAALHRDHQEWAHATGQIPPAPLPTFQKWVAVQGFRIQDGTFVYGLILAENLIAISPHAGRGPIGRLRAATKRVQ